MENGKQQFVGVLSALRRINNFACGAGSEPRLCDQSFPVVCLNAIPICFHLDTYNYIVICEV